MKNFISLSRVLLFALFSLLTNDYSAQDILRAQVARDADFIQILDQRQAYYLDLIENEGMEAALAQGLKGHLRLMQSIYPKLSPGGSLEDLERGAEDTKGVVMSELKLSTAQDQVLIPLNLIPGSYRCEIFVDDESYLVEQFVVR